MSATDGRRPRRRERGTSLVLVLMFASTIASFCLFSLASSQSVYKTAKRGLETTRAFYVAEGGIDYVLGQLAQDRYYAASTPSDLPHQMPDGSFESNWLKFGANGGTYKINVAYVVMNRVPGTFTGTGFPAGFSQYSIVQFGSRTDTPPFDRTLITATGKYNGVTRTVRANVKSQVVIYNAAIVGDGASIPGAGAGKSWSMSNQTLVMDGKHQYVYGGIRTDAATYMDKSTTPLTAANAALELTAFQGDFLSNLAGTEDEIPDLTVPGSQTQLFDFGRFKAAADAGAGMSFASPADFVVAMNAANVAGKPLQGIIYVTADASKPNNMSIPGGINIQGSLIFHFVNVADHNYKILFDMPVNINPASMPNFNADDPTTFATGYPPVLPFGKDPRDVDITPAGYANYSADDDLPALAFDDCAIDMQDAVNISGVVYSPSFIGIENRAQTLQYFCGTVLGGAGIYLEGRDNSSNYHQVFNFDPNAVDSLATFANKAKSPVIKAYVVQK
jgi:hypothetical protein